MTFASPHCVFAVILAICIAQPFDAKAEASSGTENRRIVVVIDALDQKPARSRRDARRREQAHQPVINFLRDAHDLRHAGTRSFPAVKQTWLVFRDNPSLSDTQLQMIADVHPQISNARRTITHTVRGNESRGTTNTGEPAQPIELSHVAASQRWSSGTGVQVAIIGTGADRKHPDIRERIVAARDFTDKRMRDFDEDAHGTAIASIVAGSRDTGIWGVAPDVDLLVLRACLQKQPTHYDANCDSVAIASALQFALQSDVQLLLLSFSGTTDPLLIPLIDKATQQGVIVVTAWSTEPQFEFPANLPGLVTTHSGELVDGAAVPTQLLRLPDERVLVALPGKRHGTLRGQTASTALTSGIIAMLLQRKPHMGSGVIIEQLKRSANTDSGTIDACRALGDAIGVPCSPEMLAELP